MDDDIFLVGDVGATHARYALASADSGTYRDEQVLLCEGFDSCEASIEFYLSKVSTADVLGVCLSVAGPVVDGRVSFLNNPWQLQEESLGRAFGTARVHLINDFEAVAMSLPMLSDTDVIQIGKPPPRLWRQSGFQVGLIGPGTGLGAAGLFQQNGFMLPLATEAGHIGFAPQTHLQFEVWEVLSRRFERVSNERVLSGRGLENILSALYYINDVSSDLPKAADIISLVGIDDLATQAVDMLFEILGQVAGDFALSIGAFDGVYLAGGILPKNYELLRRSPFRRCFESKGRHRSLMENIPTLLIMHPQPGLLGAAACAVGEFRAGQ